MVVLGTACTRSDKIRNENNWAKVGVTSVVDKMRKVRLRWFGQVKRRGANVRGARDWI